MDEEIDVYWVIIPLIIIGVGGTIIYFIRKTKKVEDDEKDDKEDKEEKDKRESENFLISAARYNKKHTHIIRVKVHEAKDQKIRKQPFEEDRQTVIDNIHNNKVYHTVTKNKYGMWKKGAKVKIADIKNKEFLRTDNNKEISDNLENLPEF